MSATSKARSMSVSWGLHVRVDCNGALRLRRRRDERAGTDDVAGVSLGGPGAVCRSRAVSDDAESVAPAGGRVLNARACGEQGSH